MNVFINYYYYFNIIIIVFFIFVAAKENVGVIVDAQIVSGRQSLDGLQ